MQITYQNIKRLAHNNEETAIKQAAILEAIWLKELDLNIHSNEVNIRELHNIYPKHLLTFFNKKKVLRRIQQAKLKLDAEATIEKLELLFLQLSFRHQPQIGA